MQPDPILLQNAEKLAAQASLLTEAQYSSVGQFIIDVFSNILTADQIQAIKDWVGGYGGVNFDSIEEKTVPIGADVLLLGDSEASWALKKSTLTELRGGLRQAVVKHTITQAEIDALFFTVPFTGPAIDKVVSITCASYENQYYLYTYAGPYDCVGYFEFTGTDINVYSISGTNWLQGNIISILITYEE